MTLDLRDQSIASQVAAKVAADIVIAKDGSQTDFIDWHQVVYECISGVLGPPAASASPAPAGTGTAPTSGASEEPAVERGTTSDVPDCPKCNGPMFDNRNEKKNSKAPDFRCKDQNCKTNGYRTGVWAD